MKKFDEEEMNHVCRTVGLPEINEESIAFAVKLMKKWGTYDKLFRDKPNNDYDYSTKEQTSRINRSSHYKKVKR